jgi:hypothetical protein
MMAPTEVPQTTSGSIPSANRALITPMCDQPRDAPAPRARPIFGGELSLFNAMSHRQPALLSRTPGTRPFSAALRPTGNTGSMPRYCEVRVL